MFFRRAALLAFVMCATGAATACAAVYTAAAVVSYAAGAGVSSALADPEAALSLPAESTGAGPSDGNFSPFNPHYGAGQIVQVGQGGHLTLRLERFVHPVPGVASLGVWENIFLVMASGGLTGAGASVFGADSALVEASADGTNFVPVGFYTFDWFGNYWADSAGPYAKTPGALRANFGAPHGRNLAEFSALSYSEVLALLAGSAGGTWIDLSPSGLERVGWIRFSGVGNGLTLEVDAVAINTALAGEPTSMPSLRVELAGGAAQVVLPDSLAHASYQLQYSAVLPPDWQNLEEPKLGTGGELRFTDATVPRLDRRFYRVLMP